MQDDTGASQRGLADDGPAGGQVPPDAEAGVPGDEAARPLTVPRPETGEFRVDAALSLLDDLSELPVADHPAMFEQVHARLSEVLGELGSGLGSGPGRDGS
jgi:hypothetical protein